MTIFPVCEVGGSESRGSALLQPSCGQLAGTESLHSLGTVLCRTLTYRAKLDSLEGSSCNHGSKCHVIFL